MPGMGIDPCDRSLYPPRALVGSVAALNARAEWFGRSAGNGGPWVVVVDDFYEDPDAVRALALGGRYVQYLPPLAEQVGEAVAGEYVYRPAWFSTVLLRHRGVAVRRPVRGLRHAPAALRERLGELVGERVVAETWDETGDGWNGAFHLQNRHWLGERGSIHHHWKAGDVTPRGWSGVVYLSPGAPASAGTSIWRERATGMCVGSRGVSFHREPGVPGFELALLVENRYNRLVLFRESVLHRAEHGFGESAEECRLTQTLFFCTA